MDEVKKCPTCGGPDFDVIEMIVQSAVKIATAEKDAEILEWKQRAVGGLCKVLSVGWENCDCSICKREAEIEKLKVLLSKFSDEFHAMEGNGILFNPIFEKLWTQLTVILQEDKALKEKK